MKKLVYVFVAVLAMQFATSCDKTQKNASDSDTTCACDTADMCDSISAEADSAQAE